VWLGDRQITGASERDVVDMRRTEIGYIFQSAALVSVLSAAENVELPMRLIGLPAAERVERVAELLAVVGLAEHTAQRPYELSGGQQQRLGIARALANRPRLIIADEPTGQLDSVNAEAMISLLSSLVHERGVAALVSTHDARIAAHADRILEIHDGHLGRRGAGHATDSGPV
jgi:putative ABC transport system ATP-binding protein